jgi:hypothetical protein
MLYFDRIYAFFYKSQIISRNCSFYRHPLIQREADKTEELYGAALILPADIDDKKEAADFFIFF